MLTISQRDLDQALVWLAAIRRTRDSLPLEQRRAFQRELDYHAAGVLAPIELVEEMLSQCHCSMRATEMASYTNFAEIPRGRYGVILVDPPWSFHSWSEKGSGRSASQHYRTLSHPLNLPPSTLQASPPTDARSFCGLSDQICPKPCA